VVLGPSGRRNIQIAKKNKAKPVGRALPVIRKPKGSDVDKIGVTRSTTTAMQGSSTWTGSPALQAVTKTWNASADSIESNAKVIADLRSKLAVAEAAQRGFRADWTVETRQVLAIAASVCQGSAELVQGLGLDVLAHGVSVPLGAPQNLATSQGAALGTAALTWARGNALHGFVVQHATDPANPATLSVPVPCTRVRFTFVGGTSSTVVHLRVAAIDPTSLTGQSPWSDWIAATVR
jgi:hypothetical protein